MRVALEWPGGMDPTAIARWRWSDLIAAHAALDAMAEIEKLARQKAEREAKQKQRVQEFRRAF